MPDSSDVECWGLLQCYKGCSEAKSSVPVIHSIWSTQLMWTQTSLLCSNCTVSQLRNCRKAPEYLGVAQCVVHGSAPCLWTTHGCSGCLLSHLSHLLFQFSRGFVPHVQQGTCLTAVWQSALTFLLSCVSGRTSEMAPGPTGTRWLQARRGLGLCYALCDTCFLMELFLRADCPIIWSSEKAKQVLSCFLQEQSWEHPLYHRG